MSDNVLQRDEAWARAVDHALPQGVEAEAVVNGHQPVQEVALESLTRARLLANRRRAMAQDLRGWGAGLVVIGILHLVVSSFLSPTWGLTLIIIGILTLVIKSRWMFVVIGLGLWLAALNNLTAGGFGFWTMFGLLQIYWGFKEMVKFHHYRDVA